MRARPDEIPSERWSKVYDHWLANIQDWCINRQLRWGHRIPVWYKKHRLDNVKGLEKAEGSKAVIGVIDRRTFTSELNRLPIPRTGSKTQRPGHLFSSWLWPFATMGWPERTATLKKFYPTSDLVTGPDIIFFWVARTIMAGYGFMGDLPFRNVYFTGIIRDKQGRKMSKTLGNSPESPGVDRPIRRGCASIGTMRSAPLGQDVLFDETDGSWGQFLQQTLQRLPVQANEAGEVQGEINPALLSSDDKWILIKLDQAIREITPRWRVKFNKAFVALYGFSGANTVIRTSKQASRRWAAPVKARIAKTSTRRPIQRFNDSTIQRSAKPPPSP